MDLRRWIVDEHAAVQTRFEQSISSMVPVERWTDTAGDGGSSIAFLAFHTAYHEDLACNAVLAARPTVLSTRRTELGLDPFDAAVGLGEEEPRELTAALDLAALVGYVRAVHDDAAAQLARLDITTLDEVAAGPSGLAAAGIDERAVPWLFRMWDAKPAGWFVQWEAIGHRVNHLGEMVSVRNRLGLSPF